MRDGVTVTYSVCIGGAGIDYSSVTSILYTYSAFSSSCGFTPVGWGYAGPALGPGVCDIAVTVFGTLLRWGIRFLSGVRIRCFDYSRVTRVRVLLTFSPTSLRSLRILASLRVTYCDPYCLPTLTFTHVRSFY